MLSYKARTKLEKESDRYI